MGLALPQHLGEVALGVYVRQQDPLAAQRKTGPKVIDGGAFADAILLVRHTDDFRFAISGFLLPKDLAACDEADGYVRGEKSIIACKYYKYSFNVC